MFGGIERNVGRLACDLTGELLASTGPIPQPKKEATQRGKTASPFSLVTVLTTATENREQEVMLSSPVSLAPSTLEQSKCHESVSTHIGYVSRYFIEPIDVTLLLTPK